jgi:predicted PurR-regulated permease PerM
MIDTFLKKVFAFSRVIAALVVFLCVLAVAGGIVYFLISGSKGVSTPDFDEVIETEEMIRDLGREVDRTDYKEISERRAVEKKYGDDIQEIVKEYGLTKAAYDIYVRQLLALDEEYRKQFIKGLKRFMRDGNSYIKKQGDKTDMDIADVANQYDDMFDSAIAKSEMSKIESKAKRTGALITIGSALSAMILFLIIPLLLQIEVNTRKTSTQEGQQN